MLNSSESAISFIKGLNYKSFSSDQKTLFAVIRAIEIIGEASNKVPKSLRISIQIFHGEKLQECEIN